jgi:hypothetical protein
MTVTDHIFDIETEPLDMEQLRQLAPPFVPPPRPGAFDPACVKYGNLKDATKRAEKLAECQAAHAAAVANYEETVATAEFAHWQAVLDKAALSPTTGRVVCIGIKTNFKESIISGEEPDILSSWWHRYSETMLAGGKWIGINIKQFDLPFLVRRSWIMGVQIPESAWDGRYWNRCFVDLREVWLLGQRYSDCESSLDLIARSLGLGRKLPGGANFGRLWRGTPEERAEALTYLHRDLDLIHSIAIRLGIKQK